MYLMVMIDANQFDFLQQQQQHDHEHEPQQRQETGGGGGGKRTTMSTTITIGTTTPRTPTPTTHNTCGRSMVYAVVARRKCLCFPRIMFWFITQCLSFLVVCCTKINLTKTATRRIVAFCKRHYFVGVQCVHNNLTE